MVMVKKAAALANKELQTIPKSAANAIIAACDEVLNNGKCMDQFPVDVFVAGRHLRKHEHQRSPANIGLELMGHQKGEYQYLNPNDHVNKCQSTNDAYPTGFRIAVYASILKLIDAIKQLGEGFGRKPRSSGHPQDGPHPAAGRSADDPRSGVPCLQCAAQ